MTQSPQTPLPNDADGPFAFAAYSCHDCYGRDYPGGQWLAVLDGDWCCDACCAQRLRNADSPDWNAAVFQFPKAAFPATNTLARQGHHRTNAMRLRSRLDAANEAKSNATKAQELARDRIRDADTEVGHVRNSAAAAALRAYWGDVSPLTNNRPERPQHTETFEVAVDVWQDAANIVIDPDGLMAPRNILARIEAAQASD